MRTQGFVLLTTIALIGILSLLVLSFSASLIMDFHITKDLESSSNLLKEFEENAQNIIENMHTHIDNLCFFKSKTEIIYNHVLSKGCSYNNDFLYLLEDLGDFNCIVASDGDNFITTHHYQLNLINKNASQGMLKIRFAELGRPAKCLIKALRHIDVGIQSWILFYR